MTSSLVTNRLSPTSHNIKAEQSLILSPYIYATGRGIHELNADPDQAISTAYAPL